MASPMLGDTRVQYLAEFAPSVAWIGLMVMPVAFQFHDLHPIGRTLQLGLVTAIALLMLLADGVGFRLAVARGNRIAPCRERPWLVVTGVAFLAPLALHLYLMPAIPGLALFTQAHPSESVMTQMRLASGKLMAVPSGVMYAFNWALVILAPLHIMLAWFTGHRRWAMLALALGCLYAAATWAKLPLALLLLTCAFVPCVVPGSWRSRLCQAAAGVLALIMAALALLFATGSLAHLRSAERYAQAPVLQQMAQDDPRRALTYGDNFRFDTASAAPRPGGLRDLMEYVVYRGWLTPADVSSRWYQYFLYVQQQPLGLASLVSRGDATQTPSRLVGLWAYRDRFPYKYWDIINAYASFDADAFARGGIPAVVLATLLLLLVRLGSALLVTAHPVALVGYAVGLCVLAILPSFASLQAMLGANGLILIPLLLLLIRAFVARPHSTDRAPP